MIVKCPTCRQAHEYDTRSLFRPFCSQRCQMIDMGAWSQESFRIPTDEDSELIDMDHLE